MKSRFSLYAACLLLAACAPQQPAAPAPQPAPVQAPVAQAPASDTIQPPTSGISPSAPFPSIAHRDLENGLGLRIVERHVHPIVELRLIVRSGSATDGERPGLAAVAGELLKAGGAGGMSPEKLVRRAETLGTDLEVTTDRDSTRISLGVTSGDFEQALEVLAAVAMKPAFAPIEFNKLRTREIERVKSSARGSAAWAASMVLYRELFEIPTAVHPYARFDAQPAELEKLTLDNCRQWHKAHFVPSNASLVVVGDVTPDKVETAAKKWFGEWKNQPAPSLSVNAPFAPQKQEVFLVDRPGAAQSQIYVGILGVARSNPDYPALAAANQILGGGVSSRLFLDVREKRSLAYNTGSSLGDLAHSPGPLVLSAGTQTAKTIDAVDALLENLNAIANHAPLESELASATRFLKDGFVFRLETVGSVADLTGQLYVLGLPDDYYDTLRKSLGELNLPAVTNVATRVYQKTPVIVVAGDGASLGPALAKFGPVAVLDPEHGFALKKSYPAKP
ncbi:MAG: M16 family metallopeptidase [Myxococcota bacterium]